MDHSSDITQLTTRLLDHLGLADSVSVQTGFDPADEIYQVSLETSDPGLLIGYHGETLSALQLILRQHLSAQTGQWLNLNLNVNDYKQRRQVSLQALANSIASRVVATGQPQALPPLPASERRLVHLYLSEHPQVTTASEGVGRHRSVVVSLKSPAPATAVK